MALCNRCHKETDNGTYTYLTSSSMVDYQHKGKKTIQTVTTSSGQTQVCLCDACLLKRAEKKKKGKASIGNFIGMEAIALFGSTAVGAILMSLFKANSWGVLLPIAGTLFAIVTAFNIKDQIGRNKEAKAEAERLADKSAEEIARSMHMQLYLEYLKSTGVNVLLDIPLEFSNEQMVQTALMLNGFRRSN